VETKNGSALRKNLGYAHIPQACAELLNWYHYSFLNPYTSFHRPCSFQMSAIDHRGKVKKYYPYEEVRTPYERLKTIPKAESYLHHGSAQLTAKLIIDIRQFLKEQKQLAREARAKALTASLAKSMTRQQGQW